MATNTQTDIVQGTSIEQVINQQEADNFILKYKIPLAVGLGLIILGVLAFGYIRTNSEKKQLENAAVISAFVAGPLKEFSEKKITADNLLAEIKKLTSHSKELHVLSPAIMLASDVLADTDKNSALEALNSIDGSWTGTHGQLGLLYQIRKANLLEDLGKHAESMAVLEAQLSKQHKLMETKLYFDIGRMALKIGDKERAKKNFEHILATAPQGDEFAKLAKVYLEGVQ